MGQWWVEGGCGVLGVPRGQMEGRIGKASHLLVGGLLKDSMKYLIGSEFL